MQLDEDLKQLYARALVAVTRADGAIDGEEGERLGERIALRAQLSLEDVMLAPSLQPEELSAAFHGGPFRSASVPASELARMLVDDAIYVALGKGHVTSEEGARLARYASALALSPDEFRQLTSRWLP